MFTRIEQKKRKWKNTHTHTRKKNAGEKKEQSNEKAITKKKTESCGIRTWKPDPNQNQSQRQSRERNQALREA